MPLQSVPRTSRRVLPHPPATPNPASATLKTDDGYIDAPPAARRAWEAPRAELPRRKNFELSSAENRTAFCAEWDRLQSTKQLMGLEACETKIGSIILKKEDAFTALACQVFTAYFEIAHFIQKTNDRIKLNPSLRDNSKIKEAFSAAKESFETLENIIQLEGFRPYWIDKTKEQMVQLFELTAGKLWRNATAQHQPLTSFLENISPDIVENISVCKKATLLQIGQLELGLTPFQWSPAAHFILDNFLFTDKDLAPEIIDKLKSTTINLTNKKGIKKFQTYLQALTDVYKAKGKSALQLEINGELLNAKYAIKTFRKQIINCYLDFVERHSLVADSLQQKITQDELERAVKRPHLVPEISAELTHLRQEIIELRNIIPSLEKIIFSENIKDGWNNQYFSRKSPALAHEEINSSLKQKLLFSNHEKLNLKNYLYYISKEVALKPRLHDQEIAQCVNNLWQLIETSCDEKALNRLFTQKPFSKLEWAFDVKHPNTSTEINPDEETWIEESYLGAIEMLKSEWVNWERMQQFSLMIFDPTFHRMIAEKADSTYLQEIGKKIKIASQNQQDFVLALNEALNIKSLTESEYHSAGAPLITEARNVPDKKNAILSICNLHATNHFNLTVDDAQFFLQEDNIARWHSFVTKNKTAIAAYWQFRALSDGSKNRYSVEVSSNNMIHVPFQLRINNHPAFWNRIKLKVPIKYQDAIQLTASRVKLATEQATTTVANFPSILPQLYSPHTTINHKKLVLAEVETMEHNGVMV